MATVYDALLADIKEQEAILCLVKKDYDLLGQNIDVHYGIDASEVFNFLNPTALGSQRAQVTAHVLENLEVSFTLVPLTVGELLRTFKRQATPERSLEVLGQYPEVENFMRFYRTIRKDPDRLLRLYGPVEERALEVCSLLYEDIFLHYGKGEHRERAAVFLKILKEKISPLEDLDKVPKLSRELLAENNWLRRELDETKGRRRKTRNNEIDALNYIMALHYNKTVGAEKGHYLTLYTGPGALSKACMRKPSLRTGDAYLIRNPDVLRARTKLEEGSPVHEHAYQKVKEWLSLCRRLRAETAKCAERGSKPSAKYIELCERYYQELKKTIGFRPKDENLDGLQSRAERVYRTFARGGKPRIDSSVLEEVVKLDFVRKCKEELVKYLSGAKGKGRTVLCRVQDWLGVTEESKKEPPGATGTGN